MSTYPTLNRAQLSYDYLHTNSTTHEFLFGAIVELIDNSRDANAERCDIFTVVRQDLRGGKMLCFYDDGCGMLPIEARNVMTFGYSAKRKDPAMIGQYGNGLKSGAMRIGKDMILFTKKDGIFTCLLLSRTFHEDENIDEVIVPSPSFNKNKEPLFNSEGDSAKHKLEMEIILKFSPFRTMDELLIQFDMIKGDHGTLIICYNVKLLENGEPELDFATDASDIRLSDPEGGDISDAKFHLERFSLRSYLSIIYANPRMKLYIQGKKIRTRRIVNCLYKIRSYKYSSAKFKARAEKQIQEARDQLISVQERVKENESKLAQFEKKFGSNPTKKDIRAQWRQLQDRVTLSKQDMQRLKDLTDEKIKQLKEPKVLNFMFGINLERRTHDGCFIYNNGRLIRMYEKVGPQLEGTKKCCGVVGVVDIPFVVLEPTHNKQDFADSREYRQLLRAMGDHMDQYWRDLNLAAQPGGLLQFWQQFGYIRNDWNLPPSDDEKFIKKRLMNVNLTLQCDLCLKWRILPYESKQAKGEFLDTWSCSQNPDTACNKCSAPEKLPNFPSGKLEKEIVTVDQKRELLEKKIQKQQAELEQISKLTDVKSQRDLSAAESRIKKQVETPSRMSARQAAALQNQKSRRKSPSPIPPKKPRTKADLRKQMEIQSEEGSSGEEDDDNDENGEDEDESEEDVNDDTNISLPSNKKTSNKVTAKTPIAKKFPVKTTASSSGRSPGRPPGSGNVGRPSNTIGRNSSNLTSPKPSTSTPKLSTITTTRQTPASSQNGRLPITVTLDKTSKNEKKSSVEKLEAHSTNAADDAAVVSSSNGAIQSSTSQSPSQSQVDELSSRLRRFLYYFLPPNWTKLTKQQVGLLTPDELISKVDLPEFFQAYECGLKKLVADHQKTADTAQQQLRRLRSISSTVLKRLKPEAIVDAGCDTDAVDKLFETLVQE